jgi:hypothetical protein
MSAKTGGDATPDILSPPAAVANVAFRIDQLWILHVICICFRFRSLTGTTGTAPDLLQQGAGEETE